MRWRYRFTMVAPPLFIRGLYLVRLSRYEQLVGNSHAVSLIKKSWVSNRFPKFVILGGVLGTGKSTVAEISSLYGTCENPDVKKVEPCLQCRMCKKNLDALKKTGISSNIVKKNMGSIQGDNKMSELLHEIFEYKAGIGRKFYIIEEVHLLSSLNQGRMLEELSRLDDNSYLIACTTRLGDVIPELKDRAITFVFNRLTDAESRILLEREFERLNVSLPSSEDIKYILKSCRGIPRSIVNTVEFLTGVSPTQTELQAYLGYIGQEAFTEIFSSVGDSRYYFSCVDRLLIEHHYERVYEQLQEYVVSLLFAVEGNIYDTISEEHVKSIGIDGYPTVRKIREAIKNYPKSQADVQMMFCDVKAILTRPKVNESSKIDKQIEYAESNHITFNQVAPTNLLDVKTQAPTPFKKGSRVSSKIEMTSFSAVPLSSLQGVVNDGSTSSQ
jgi:DNA polymerase III gamma/tau subunit